MKELLIGFSGAIIGGIFSLLGQWISSRGENKLLIKSFSNQWSLEHMRNCVNRLEELYQIMSDRMRYFNTKYIGIKEYLDGNTTKEPLVKILSEERKYDSSRMEMIIAVYLEDLKDVYKRYDESVYQFTKKLFEFQHLLKGEEEIDSENMARISKDLKKLFEKVNKESDDLLDSIARKVIESKNFKG